MKNSRFKTKMILCAILAVILIFGGDFIEPWNRVICYYPHAETTDSIEEDYDTLEDSSEEINPQEAYEYDQEEDLPGDMPEEAGSGETIQIEIPADSDNAGISLPDDREERVDNVQVLPSEPVENGDTEIMIPDQDFEETISADEESEETISADEEREETNGLIPDDFIVPDVVPAGEISPGKKKVQRKLPSAFDSRDQGVITEVKNQGDTSICWAYSAVACAESSALMNHLEEMPDYSERHLAYFFAKPVFQTTGICGNDSTYYIDMADDYMHAGGNNRYVTFEMANWIGVAQQSAYPDDESWSAGESYESDDRRAIDDCVHLETAAWIPMTNREYIKQEIMNNGCVAAAYYYKKGAYYNTETCAYYNDSFTSTNHAVNIIGWDDDYPAENFLQIPESNGAWLVRNSWGSEFGENGYFWISYDDLSISSPYNTAFAFEFGSADNYDNIYYYDGSCGTRTRSISNGDAFANVFTVCGNNGWQDESIEAVGAGFSEAGITYELSIYTDLRDKDDPTSGTLALAGVTGITETAGYQTIELENPVKAAFGSSFSVVLKLNGKGSQVSMFADQTYENGNWVGFCNETEKGQSFAGNGSGGWVDLHGEGISMRIKAFTANLSAVTVDHLLCEGENNGILLKRGESGRAEVAAVLQCGAIIDLDEGELSWTSSDESVVIVSENGEIKTVTPGKAVLTAQLIPNDCVDCIAEEQSSSLEAGEPMIIQKDLSVRIPIEVYGDISECEIQIAGTPCSFTGKKIEPSLQVSDRGKSLSEGKDYTVAFSSNINAGKARAAITGIGNYKGVAMEEFVIKKTSQSITAKSSALSIAAGRSATVSITGARGSKSFKSSNTAVATVSSTGKVTAKKIGTVKITATAAATDNYNAASKTVTIKVVPAATASIAAANQATGIKLTWKKVTGATGYKVYRGSTLVKTITRGSTVSFTDTKANTNGAKYTFKIVPTAATGNGTVKSFTTYRLARPAISSAKNSASKRATVKWGKNARATGYQIQYSTSKTFASGNKTASITKAGTVSKVIGSLAKGKTYYVRIRTYKTVGKIEYWSAWSVAKSVIIKK